MVVPGIKYGMRGELIPNARSFLTCLHLYERDDVDIDLVENITDDDSAQRGPDGKPLARVTPGVPYQTLAEWKKLEPVTSNAWVPTLNECH